MGTDDGWDMSVVMCGVQPWYPTDPQPYEPVEPWVIPNPILPPATSTITIVEDKKLSALKRLASEMKGAGEALIESGRRRYGKMLIKYSKKLMQELEKD